MLRIRGGHGLCPGSGTWFRKKQFDRDPDKGGVFARTFVNDERRSAVVAFKGICDTLGRARRPFQWSFADYATLL